jgi:uncharacterized peroxidase-related enzyme
MDGHGEFLRSQGGDSHIVEAIKKDFRKANISIEDMGLLEFASKLTGSPGEMDRADINGLRKLGFDDEQIFHAIAVCGLYNNNNRVAQGCGLRH